MAQVSRKVAVQEALPLPHHSLVLAQGTCAADSAARLSGRLNNVGRAKDMTGSHGPRRWSVRSPRRAQGLAKHPGGSLPRLAEGRGPRTPAARAAPPAQRSPSKSRCVGVRRPRRPLARAAASPARALALSALAPARAPLPPRSRACRSGPAAMPLMYSFVARGQSVLVEHAAYQGNFSKVAAECLAKCPSHNAKFTYNADKHTFNFIVHDGFSARPPWARAPRPLRAATLGRPQTLNWANARLYRLCARSAVSDACVTCGSLPCGCGRGVRASDSVWLPGEGEG